MDVAEVGGVFVYEIIESAWGGDYYVRGLQGQALRVFGYAAVDADGGKVGGRGEGLDLGVNLRGEFAGGGNDDRSCW